MLYGVSLLPCTIYCTYGQVIASVTAVKGSISGSGKELLGFSVVARNGVFNNNHKRYKEINIIADK